MDNTEYNTIMFVEEKQDIGKYICGYQLNKDNYILSPTGIIRIARYKNNFNIKNQNSESYYSDMYLKLFITNKKRNIEKKLTQLVLNKNKPFDIITNICNML